MQQEETVLLLREIRALLREQGDNSRTIVSTLTELKVDLRALLNGQQEAVSEETWENPIRGTIELEIAPEVQDQVVLEAYCPDRNLEDPILSFMIEIGDEVAGPELERADVVGLGDTLRVFYTPNGEPPEGDPDLKNDDYKVVHPVVFSADFPVKDGPAVRVQAKRRQVVSNDDLQNSPELNDGGEELANSLARDFIEEEGVSAGIDFSVTYTREDGENLTVDRVMSILEHPVSAGLSRIGTLQVKSVVVDLEDQSSATVTFRVISPGSLDLTAVAAGFAAYRGTFHFPEIGAVTAEGRAELQER